MCLTLHTPNLKTAKADIIVYKVVEFDNKSAAYMFQYEPNTLYRLRKALKPYDDLVREGFHSWEYEYCGKSWIFASTGLEIRKRKMVKFVIPKGAKYYVGTDDDCQPCFVSTSIRSGSLVEGEI